MLKDLEEYLTKFFCAYHDCSDSCGEIYPKCNMAFKSRCPQATKPATIILSHLKDNLKHMEYTTKTEVQNEKEKEFNKRKA